MPAGSLAEDPTYLAYLRALNFDQATAERIASQRRDQVQRRVAFTVPQIQEQGQQMLEGVMHNQEDRGLLRSGQTEKRLAETRRGTQYQLGNLELAATEDLLGIDTDLVTQVAQLQRAQAERNLDLAGTQYLNTGKIGLLLGP